ncbi:MAG: PilN domain-containing protein [Tibeticola sp.]
MTPDLTAPDARRLQLPPALQRFWRWWRGELVAMMPAWMRQPEPDPLAYDQFLLPASVAVAELRLRRLDATSETGARSFPLGGDLAAQRESVLAALQPASTDRNVKPPEAVVVLPPERVLRRRLSLPLATEDNLRQVLEFQIEQLTPFTLAQVHFGHRVVSRDPERGLLQVDFCATPRTGADEALKALGAWGIAVRGLVALPGREGEAPINLLPQAQPPMPSVWRRALWPWLAALVVLLALAALALPIVIKREASIALLPWLDKARAAAEATDALRKEVEGRLDAYNFAPLKKIQRPSVLVSLEELTRVLPDDTWVTQVDIKGAEVQIQGETGSSSKLVGLFEQSTVFTNASFRSPLTKGASPGTERYFLALEIRPASSAASAATGTSVVPVPQAQGPASMASAPASAVLSPVSSASGAAPPASRSETPTTALVKAPPASAASGPVGMRVQPMIPASKPAEPTSAAGVGPRKP